MSAKFYLVVIVLLFSVFLTSVLIGTRVLERLEPSYVPSEQILTSLFLFTDGSWSLRVKNDYSLNITILEVFISVNDKRATIQPNVSLSPSEQVIIKSDYLTRTSPGIAGFNYLAFVRVTYLVSNTTYTVTRQHTGFFKQV